MEANYFITELFLFTWLSVQSCLIEGGDLPYILWASGGSLMALCVVFTKTTSSNIMNIFAAEFCFTSTEHVPDITVTLLTS